MIEPEDVMRMVNAGMKQRAIARSLGCHQSRISQIVAAYRQTFEPPERVSFWTPWESRTRPELGVPPVELVSAWNRGVGGCGPLRRAGSRPERAR